MELPSVICSLSPIDDRRSDENKSYPLPLLFLYIAFYSSISKHDSWYTIQDYALRHMSPVLGDSASSFSGEMLEHVIPPTTPAFGSGKSSRSRSLNNPTKTGSQPYFGGTKRHGRSAVMARQCVGSRSSALTPSRTSSHL